MEIWYMFDCVFSMRLHFLCDVAQCILMFLCRVCVVLCKTQHVGMYFFRLCCQNLKCMCGFCFGCWAFWWRLYFLCCNIKFSVVLFTNVYGRCKQFSEQLLLLNGLFTVFEFLRFANSFENKNQVQAHEHFVLFSHFYLSCTDLIDAECGSGLLLLLLSLNICVGFLFSCMCWICMSGWRYLFICWTSVKNICVLVEDLGTYLRCRSRTCENQWEHLCVCLGSAEKPVVSVKLVVLVDNKLWKHMGVCLRSVDKLVLSVKPVRFVKNICENICVSVEDLWK